MSNLAKAFALSFKALHWQKGFWACSALNFPNKGIQLITPNVKSLPGWFYFPWHFSLFLDRRQLHCYADKRAGKLYDTATSIKNHVLVKSLYITVVAESGFGLDSRKCYWDTLSVFALGLFSGLASNCFSQRTFFCLCCTCQLLSGQTVGKTAALRSLFSR